MTMQREHTNGPFVVQCDNCEDAEELEGVGFHSALDDAKERGFVPVYNGGNWKHYCAYCFKQGATNG